MKKLLMFLLLLCLGFTACRYVENSEKTVADTKLPESKSEPLKPVAASAQKTERLPVLSSSEGETPTVSGPAGTVEARSFLGAWCSDPVYADVDADGETELIYLCPGPTSGLFTEGICVYGLERGWPVLKACTIYKLNWDEQPHLELEGNELLFRLKPDVSHTGAEASGETLSLPVSMRENQVLLNGGELPAELSIWGGEQMGYLGASFSALSQQLGEGAVLRHWSCLIWQEECQTISNSEQINVTKTYAARTDNGVTVTGLLCWINQRDGDLLCLQNGIEVLPPLEDPQGLVGLTAAKLEAKLGPCHIDLGSGHFIPCWFTEDGKLLICCQHGDNIASARLVDMLTGEPLFEQQPDSDTVYVDQCEIPTIVKNSDRWQAFLEKTERGEADAVTLRLIYDESSFSLPLSYDGSVYTVQDENGLHSYKNLIVSEEQNPPDQASFQHAVHYLLSDDSHMSSQRYFAHICSSTLDLDFPNTQSVFTIYDP